MTTLREAATMALEALEYGQYSLKQVSEYQWERRGELAMHALRAALAEPTVKESLTTGSCIACGNRMTGSPESFVVATAEVGVTAPEGYSPQQVEALHPHKGGDKTAPPLAEPAQEQAKPQGCDHCNHPLYAATKCRVCGRVTEQAEPVQEPVAVIRTVVGPGDDGVRIKWLRGFPQIGDRLYAGPVRAEPLTEPPCHYPDCTGGQIGVVCHAACPRPENPSFG